MTIAITEATIGRAAIIILAVIVGVWLLGKFMDGTWEGTR